MGIFLGSECESESERERVKGGSERICELVGNTSGRRESERGILEAGRPHATQESRWVKDPVHLCLYEKKRKEKKK